MTVPNGPRHPGAVGGAATAVLRGYISMWNERDPHARRSIGRDVFIPDAHYVDPNVFARDRAAIDTYVAGWQDQFPGFAFVLGEVRSHHDVAHFDWHFGWPGEAPAAAGVDVVTMEQGRISAVYGFFDFSVQPTRQRPSTAPAATHANPTRMVATRR